MERKEANRRENRCKDCPFCKASRYEDSQITFYDCYFGYNVGVWSVSIETCPRTGGKPHDIREAGYDSIGA